MPTRNLIGEQIKKTKINADVLTMIPCEKLPSCLWQAGVLHLPDDVNNIYEERLTALGLYNQAVEHRSSRGVHGGVSRQETHNHFAALYANSVSRVECVLLDPHKAFSEIPRDLLLTLSSHQIYILDIPCGTGGAAISAIATLKELRNAGIIPSMPLSISILGADISPHALEIYQDQITLLTPLFASSGINVSLTSRVWDATDVQQTNELIDELLVLGESHNEYLVLLSNFSGASKSLFEQFQDSFRQIWIRLSSKTARSSTILWVEPEMDDAKKLFKRLGDIINRYAWFLRVPSKRENYLTCRYHWFVRLQKKAVSSGVMVHKYNRAN